MTPVLDTPVADGPLAARRGRAVVAAVRRIWSAAHTALTQHDVVLLSAALTCYAVVSLVPFIYLSSWIASKLLGAGAYAAGSRSVSAALGDADGLGAAVRRLLTEAERAPALALVSAAVIAALYGEAFSRTTTVVIDRSPRTRTFLKARLKSLFVVAAGGVLMAFALLLAGWLERPLVLGPTTLLDVYVRFLLIWGLASVLLAVSFTTFGRAQLSWPSTLLSAAAAGSWVAGSSLGYLYVLSLDLRIEAPFAGNLPLAVGVLLVSWMFLNHLVITVSYAAAVLLRRSSARAGPAAVPA